MKEMPTPRQETKRRRIAPSETAARYAGRAHSTTNVRNRTKRSLRAVRKRASSGLLRFTSRCSTARSLARAALAHVLATTIVRFDIYYPLVLKSDRSPSHKGQCARRLLT